MNTFDLLSSVGMMAVAVTMLTYGTRQLRRFGIVLVIALGQFAYAAGGFAGSESAEVSYGLAAVCDFGIMLALSRFRACTLTADIMLINLISIAVNGLGYIAYYLYVVPVYYEWAMTILMVIQLLRLLVIRKADENELQTGIWHALIQRAIRLGQTAMGVTP